MIDTLFSGLDEPKWPDHLAVLGDMPRPDPFAAGAMDFVGALSQRLLSSAAAKQFPELAALAYWFRPSSLERIKQELMDAAGGQMLRPRGSTFIIAPANVDVLFIYGWLLSLLSGNATVVRVSQKPSAARDAFIALVRDMAPDERFRAALASSAIVSYPHSDATTRLFSAWCDLRLIWGGDATVNAIRAVPLKPTAVEGAFADRFSIAAFDAGAILAAGEVEVTELARRFANDTMWFGQQACSSPRILFWLGAAADVAAARQRFWPLFEQAARGFGDEPAAMMSRITDLFVMAAQGVVDAVEGPLSALPARAFAREPHADVRELHSGFGLFVEHRLERLDALADFLVDKDQTLVVHGVPAEEIGRLVDRLPNRSLDRIVRIGQATDFATSWDGINLLDLTTRRISVSRMAASAQAHGRT